MAAYAEASAAGAHEDACRGREADRSCGRRAWAAVVFIVAAAAWGCGSRDTAVDTNANLQAEAADDGSADFRVVLGNAISDTLTGNAEFGILVEPESRGYRLVIRLATGFDFAGGIVFARSDTSLPAAGDYRLTAPTDSLTVGEGGEFAMFYREGMLRDLRASSGTLTLSTVTDTLIVGRFDATLRGLASNLILAATTAEVHASGRFRAESGLQGYVIGLGAARPDALSGRP